MEEALNKLVKQIVAIDGVKCIGDYLLKEGEFYRWKDWYFTAEDVKEIYFSRGKNVPVLKLKRRLK